MKELIITISIVLAIFGILLLFFFITLAQHNKVYGKRHTSDPRVTFYTKEEFGLEAVPVTIPVGKVQLHGFFYYYPGYDESKVLVYAHGMWSGVSAYMQDIEFFCRKGMMVLALDHEGTDLSEGKNIRGLANSLRCIDYEITWLKNQPEFQKKKIYVAGHSWGGFATVNVIKYHPDIAGICAFAPFMQVKTCIKPMFGKAFYLIYPWMMLIEWMKCGKYAFANGFKSLKEYKGKVVILHSKDDNWVNFSINTAAMMKENTKIQYMIYVDKDHNPHYTDEALTLMHKYYQEIKNLHGEEKTKYMKQTNFHKMGELDLFIMEQAYKLFI